MATAANYLQYLPTTTRRYGDPIGWMASGATAAADHLYTTLTAQAPLASKLKRLQNSFRTAESQLRLLFK